MEPYFADSTYGGGMSVVCMAGTCLRHAPECRPGFWVFIASVGMYAWTFLGQPATCRDAVVDDFGTLVPVGEPHHGHWSRA